MAIITFELSQDEAAELREVLEGAGPDERWVKRMIMTLPKEKALPEKTLEEEFGKDGADLLRAAVRLGFNNHVLYRVVHLIRTRDFLVRDHSLAEGLEIRDRIEQEIERDAGMISDLSKLRFGEYTSALRYNDWF